MIGDRSHDMVGAKNNGMKGIGVLYGYGSREELIEAGALPRLRHARARSWAAFPDIRPEPRAGIPSLQMPKAAPLTFPKDVA